MNRHALVIVRRGPADERGRTGLRLAMSLWLGGWQVEVHLRGDAVLLASAALDVRAWAGGDPRADLRGLLDDAGVPVSAGGEGQPPPWLAAGVTWLDEAGLLQRCAAADLVVPV